MALMIPGSCTRLKPVALWLTVFALLLAGCGGSSGTTAQRPKPSDAQLLEALKADIAKSSGDVPNRNVLGNTSFQRDVAACMKAAGYDYAQLLDEPQPAPGATGDQTSFGFLDSIKDTDVAQQVKREAEPIANPNDPILAKLSKSEQEGWKRSREGCARKVSGRRDYETTGAAYDRYYKDVVGAADSNPAVIAAAERWSQCMRAKGIDAQSPRELLKSFSAMAGPYQAKWEKALDSAVANYREGGSAAGTLPVAKVFNQDDLTKLLALQEQERKIYAASKECDPASYYQQFDAAATAKVDELLSLARGRP